MVKKPKAAKTPKTAKTIDDVIDAALALASGRAWRDIRLTDIAGEAGMTLDQLRALASSKTSILRAFAKRCDQQFLASVVADPVAGDVHDRLFDIIMRRLELLQPHKAAIANIISGPADGAADWAVLYGTLIDAQGWTLAAAGIEASGPREAVKRHGLALVSARVLNVWARDDDAGLARTMATLDRSLRDGATWLGRLEAPIAMCSAFANLAASVIQRRNSKPQQSDDPQPDAGNS